MLPSVRRFTAREFTAHACVGNQISSSIGPMAKQRALELSNLRAKLKKLLPILAVANTSEVMIAETREMLDPR
jgi:hypothetical protein